MSFCVPPGRFPIITSRQRTLRIASSQSPPGPPCSPAPLPPFRRHNHLANQHAFITAYQLHNELHLRLSA
ncbi:hypothetical protein E2C01_031946 [Portunus trituberculatus]|uniref:Uncharacterized protein n=1 Tax=Portunus trituberculatus TaxID=210409 RepID=A0A5B7EZJ3_PORTR|nr:hypothetical protein [Portunus trituberculatus]